MGNTKKNIISVMIVWVSTNAISFHRAMPFNPEEYYPFLLKSTIGCLLIYALFHYGDELGKPKKEIYDGLEKAKNQWGK